MSENSVTHLSKPQCFHRLACGRYRMPVSASVLAYAISVRHDIAPFSQLGSKSRGARLRQHHLDQVAVAVRPHRHFVVHRVQHQPGVRPPARRVGLRILSLLRPPVGCAAPLTLWIFATRCGRIWATTRKRIWREEEGFRQFSINSGERMLTNGGEQAGKVCALCAPHY